MILSEKSLLKKICLFVGCTGSSLQGRDSRGTSLGLSGSRSEASTLAVRELSGCGARTQLLWGMWHLLRPGIEPMSPALEGGFLTTGPLGESLEKFLHVRKPLRSRWPIQIFQNSKFCLKTQTVSPATHTVSCFPSGDRVTLLNFEGMPTQYSSWNSHRLSVSCSFQGKWCWIKRWPVHLMT